MAKLFPSPGPIDIRGFVKSWVNRRQRGHVKNGTKSDSLPNIGDNDDGTEIPWVSEHGHSFFRPTHLLEEGTNEAIRVQESRNHPANNDKRNEIRHVGDRLNETLERLPFHRIEA